MSHRGDNLGATDDEVIFSLQEDCLALARERDEALSRATAAEASEREAREVLAGLERVAVIHGPEHPAAPCWCVSDGFPLLHANDSGYDHEQACLRARALALPATPPETKPATPATTTTSEEG